MKIKFKSISLKNFKTFQSVELKVLTTYPFSIMLRFEANPRVSVFVETRCLASLFRGKPSLETRSIASLQWKQSLLLSTFDKLIGGKTQGYTDYISV